MNLQIISYSTLHNWVSSVIFQTSATDKNFPVKFTFPMKYYIFLTSNIQLFLQEIYLSQTCGNCPQECAYKITFPVKYLLFVIWISSFITKEMYMSIKLLKIANNWSSLKWLFLWILDLLVFTDIFVFKEMVRPLSTGAGKGSKYWNRRMIILAYVTKLSYHSESSELFSRKLNRLW